MLSNTASSATASKPFLVGRASGVPKIIPKAVKARAVALLVELDNAEHAAAQVMREFPGSSVSGSSVIRWSSGLGLDLRAGRKKGSPGIVSRVSPWRAKVADCAARGLSQTEARAELNAALPPGAPPISRQEVSRYWPR